jgi:Fe-S-cluster containining protein
MKNIDIALALAFMAFECQKCAKCCANAGDHRGILAYMPDLALMAAANGNKNATEFVKEETEDGKLEKLPMLPRGTYRIVGSPCPYLGKVSHQCTIYDGRPHECRVFPFQKAVWSNAMNDYTDQRIIIDLSCPGVTELLGRFEVIADLNANSSPMKPLSDRVFNGYIKAYFGKDPIQPPISRMETLARLAEMVVVKESGPTELVLVLKEEMECSCDLNATEEDPMREMREESKHPYEKI